MKTSASTSYHHGDLRNALLKSAMAIMAEKSVADISIRDIASRTGVSPMALYRHFPDKEALLVAVAEHGFRELRDTLKQADASAGAGKGDGLKALAVAYVTFACQHRSLFRLMFGPITGTAPRAQQQAGDTAYDVLALRVAADMNPKDPGSFKVGCWALVHGLAVLIMDRRIPDIEDDQAVILIERTVVAMLTAD
jgi:AcrR family transcriptional regulator